MLEVFVDGACSHNPGMGGWGAVIIDEQQQILTFSGSADDTTNNRMELMAAIQALERIPVFNTNTINNIKINTDSRYLEQGIQHWLKLWKQHQWKTAAGKSVKNRDLWERLEKVLAQHRSVTWHWIKGHDGHLYQEMADRLARSAVLDLKKSKN